MIIRLFGLDIYGVILTFAFRFIDESQAHNLELLLIRQRNREVHDLSEIPSLFL